MTERTSVLVISHDVVGQQMAGPGIRYYHLARVLARDCAVILAVPHELAPHRMEEPGFRIVQYTRQDWPSIEHLVRQAQVIFFPSDIASDFPALNESGACLVVDGYDPLLAEWLALSQSPGLAEQEAHWRHRMVSLTHQYLLGDSFVCASERQRDWWLGLLEAHGRINPRTFQEDPSLRRLIDVVPFGLPEEPPQHTRAIIKEIWQGIERADRLILWGGGLWPWLDPLTAIRAIAKVQPHRPDVKLIFPGTRHPNPWMAGMPTHNQTALETARELGLLDRTVFFGEWVPYADWPNVLLESDVALSLHYDTLETRLAFRSRVLDYIWAGLPVIATRGDATSDLVAAYGVGILVDSEDVEGVSQAILHLLDTPRETFRERFEHARRELTWERAARPLVEFCRHPRRAPDKEIAPPGSPYYQEQLFRCQEQLHRQEAAVARLGALVAGYEQGRFIRFMRFVHQVRKRLRHRR